MAIARTTNMVAKLHKLNGPIFLILEMLNESPNGSQILSRSTKDRNILNDRVSQSADYEILR